MEATPTKIEKRSSLKGCPFEYCPGFWAGSVPDPLPKSVAQQLDAKPQEKTRPASGMPKYQNLCVWTTELQRSLSLFDNILYLLCVFSLDAAHGGIIAGAKKTIEQISQRLSLGGKSDAEHHLTESFIKRFHLPADEHPICARKLHQHTYARLFSTHLRSSCCSLSLGETQAHTHNHKHTHKRLQIISMLTTFSY